MNPLRRKLTDAIALTGMRPPLSLPTGVNIDLRGKRVLVTGASSGRRSRCRTVRRAGL